MTDDSDPQKPMTVTLHKHTTGPDITFERSLFDECGISVDNAVPIGVLEALVDRMIEVDNANPIDPHEAGYQSATNHWKNELQEIIAEHQGDSDD